jgi:hypothetical protein
MNRLVLSGRWGKFEYYKYRKKRQSPVRATDGPVHLGAIHLAFRSLTVWVRVKQAFITVVYWRGGMGPETTRGLLYIKPPMHL